MADNSVLSALCAGIASSLLYWHGCTLLAGIFFICFCFFLSKLVESKKIPAPEDFRVIIIGSGVSGVCMGKKLNDAGIKYTILEKSEKLGGTWYDNIYPGVACDVPSHLYTFSFLLNPDWSRAYSGGKEIHAYVQNAASRFGVYPHIKFGQRVTECTWDQNTCLWTVQTQQGTSFTANVIISGSGALHVPNIPEFQGKDSFKGESFHTAMWNNSFDPRNKKVAVIGTGASAVQAVPQLSSSGADSIKVFQRTPCWAPPRLDYAYPQFVKTMFKLFPITNILHRWFFFWRGEVRYWLIFSASSWISQKVSKFIHNQVRAHYRHIIKDKELAEKLVPTFNMGCKRITPSDTYLQAFNEDNVHLITDKIEEITERGIRTVDGKEHEVNTIVYATGFDILKSANAYKLIGLNGKLLSEVFEDAPYAHLGITHADAPNTFWLLGPGTGLGHNSIIYMIECQANYTVDAIRQLIETGARAMVVKPEVHRNYWDWTRKNMKGKVFSDSKACTGWYMNKRGVNWTLWPLDLVTYWWKTRVCTLQEFDLTY